MVTLFCDFVYSFQSGIYGVNPQNNDVKLIFLFAFNFQAKLHLNKNEDVKIVMLADFYEEEKFYIPYIIRFEVLKWAFASH